MKTVLILAVISVAFSGCVSHTHVHIPEKVEQPVTVNIRQAPDRIALVTVSDNNVLSSRPITSSKGDVETLMEGGGSANAQVSGL